MIVDAIYFGIKEKRLNYNMVYSIIVMKTTIQLDKKTVQILKDLMKRLNAKTTMKP